MKTIHSTKNRTRGLKKLTAAITAALCMVYVGAASVFAASNLGNAQEFVDGAVNVLSIVVTLIGGGLAAFGVVNLLEGYGGENAGAKAQ
ncbi:MAG: Maff2 family mobile element protein [Ruminococcus sp.]